VRAIVRRLARLEDRYVPREDAESERLRERLSRNGCKRWGTHCRGRAFTTGRP
jgi:hypothetical protein